MTWIVIGVVVLGVAVLAYFFRPLLKRIFTRKKIKEGNSSDSARDRKYQKKEQRQRKKEEKYQRKEAKGLDKKDRVIECQDNEAGRIQTEEKDSDVKVNYDNFDLGGLFSEDKPVKKDDMGSYEEFSDDFEDIYEKYFSETKKDDSVRKDRLNPFGKKVSDPFSFNPDGVVETDEEKDLSDFLMENNLSRVEDNPVKTTFENLSPEIKALILSNFLDKKDY
jgi:hypothetical protein